MDSVLSLARYSERNPFFLTILFMLFELYNIVFYESSAGALLSAAQIIVVMSCIIAGKPRHAFFYHIVFIVTCFNYGLIALDESYSYAKIKLFGPLTISYILIGLIWMLSLRAPVKIGNSLLAKARKVMLYLMFGGMIIGILGMLVNPYYRFSSFVSAFLYIAIGVLHIDVFLRLYSHEYAKVFFLNVIYLIAASPIASFFSFTVFGISAVYAGEESLISNPIYNMVPALIIALFQLKDRKLLLLCITSLVFLVLCSAIMSRGSTYLTIFIALVLLGYILYFKRPKGFKYRAARVAIPCMLFLGLPVLIGSITESGGVSAAKWKEFSSLMNIFDVTEDWKIALMAIPVSPYVRIVETLNIIDNGLSNPLALFLGNGYGGYFVDSLDLFNRPDVFLGAYSDEIISSGKFPIAHSVYPCALLYNGVIGLFMLLSLGFKYLKRVDKTFMVYGAFMLFMYGFYFDNIAEISYLSALFGASYVLQNNSKQAQTAK